MHQLAQSLLHFKFADSLLLRNSITSRLESSARIDAKMLSSFFVMGSVATAIQCPGSKAWIHHASCQVSVTFTGTSCGEVYGEMTARIAGNGGWVDPHNAGTYSVMEGSVQGKELHSKRLTGNKKFTDLQLFEFSEDGGDCVMTGCSESQVTSYADFSTNYCNLHDLYCGSSDGCKFVKSDLKYKEEVKSCSSADKGHCKPSDQALMFLEQKNVKPRGGDFDENGCRASLGQEYCAPLRKCIRPWEEKCEELGCSDCLDRQKRGENISCPMCVMTV